MVDEVRQIEGKVIEISKLQELFSQHVLEQVKCYDMCMSPTAAEYTEHSYNCNCTCSQATCVILKYPYVQAEQIDNVYDTTVGAAENVIEGNEQIKGVSSIARYRFM